LIFTGAQDAGLRVAVRPSGTEPKIKCYLEVSLAPGADLTDARVHADEVMRQAKREIAELLGG
jgi:phosphomannomutase